MTSATSRVLLSAYACEPDKGSEPGVGWNWAVEMAEAGHETHVITRANNRDAIERHAAAIPPRLHFHYFDLGPRTRALKRLLPFGVHLYYVLWQRQSLAVAKEIIERHGVQQIHHITFGVFRHASPLWKLGLPLTVGPVGGGETAPRHLRRHLGWKAKAQELLRDSTNAIARLNPALRRCYERCSVILAKTPETKAALPSAAARRASVLMEIGIAPSLCTDHRAKAPRRAEDPLQVLYVGRFVGWKGMGLGLRAVAELQRRGIPVRLTMVGAGPQAQEWRVLAGALGLRNGTTWVSWVPRADLPAYYDAADVLLFPSLHDSSGNVALEAMARGTPVVCLATGGPAVLVSKGGGRAAGIGASEAEAVSNLADALQSLCDPVAAKRLSDEALLVARQRSWSNVVRSIWPLVPAGS